MSPENNTDIKPTDSPQSSPPTTVGHDSNDTTSSQDLSSPQPPSPTSDISISDTSNMSENAPSPTADPAMPDSVQPTSFTPNSNTPTVIPSGASQVKSGSVPSKKSGLKVFILVFVFSLILGAVAAMSYKIGKGQKVVVSAVTSAPKPINLPPQAIVTAECVPGRGKQYIIPKDIPVGPIYDVKNSKVIAIEYVLGLRALASSDAFSTTLLKLTKDYPVDHFSVVPEQPKPTDTDQFIHLIMFIVSKSEANSITCGGSSSTSNASQTPTTIPSTTNTTSTQSISNSSLGNTATH